MRTVSFRRCIFWDLQLQTGLFWCQIKLFTKHNVGDFDLNAFNTISFILTGRCFCYSLSLHIIYVQTFTTSPSEVIRCFFPEKTSDRNLDGSWGLLKQKKKGEKNTNRHEPAFLRIMTHIREAWRYVSESHVLVKSEAPYSSRTSTRWSVQHLPFRSCCSQPLGICKICVILVYLFV